MGDDNTPFVQCQVNKNGVLCTGQSGLLHDFDIVSPASQQVGC